MADINIVLKQTYRGQQVRNVLTFNNINFPEPEAQELADNIRLAFLNQVRDRLTSTWSLDGIEMVYNEVAPIFTIDVPFTLGPLTGTNSNLRIATTNALLVSLQSQNPPPNRGRIYFAGLGADSMGTDGLWEPAAISAFQIMVEAWKDGIATAGSEFFLRIGRKNPSGLITASTPVTSVIGRPIPATQRRRRIGQGS